MLDEPFNGLDPEGIIWMRGFLRRLAGEGRAVLVSSHLMSELQDTASDLVVIGRGRLVAESSVADLVAAASGGRVALRTAARNEAMTALADAGASGGRDRTGHSRRVGARARGHCRTPKRAKPPVLGGVHSTRDARGGVHGPDTRLRRVPCRGYDAMNLYQSRIPIGRESFGQLVRAEWTKLRSVRGWKIAIFLALALTVALAITIVSGRSQGSINGVVTRPHVTTGPGGEPVTDTFFFVQQPLTGNGTITARVTSLFAPSLGRTVCAKRPGRLDCTATRVAGGPGSSLAPWAKAGLIVKASDTEGSAYAAVMVTPAHGVRMQWNYVNDVAGDPGAVSAKSPRWLRLTRSGNTLTGYDSTDGRNWSEIDTVRLGGLAATVDIGLFVTSPQLVTVIRNGGLGGTVGGSVGSTPSLAQATMDFVNLDHTGAARAWHGIQVGDNDLSAYPSVGGGYYLSPAGTFTIAGSGDIAPAAIGGPGGNGQPIDITLVGGFLGLLVLIMLGTVFITDEYRRGLIRTTLAASPRRGRVLAAKAVVVGAVSFVVGVVAATVCVIVGGSLLRSQGNLVYAVSALTEVRMIVGAGAVLAVGAVMALALGTVLRHGAGVIVGLLALFVLPEFLSVAAVLPAGVGEWLLRLTPAAGFAVEQSLQAFSQVTTFLLAPVWLLPAAAVGRVPRALRLRRCRAGTRQLPARQEGRVRDVLRAEWTKLRTLPTAAWLLLATVVVTVGLSAAVTGARNPTLHRHEPRRDQAQPGRRGPRPGGRRTLRRADDQRRVRLRADQRHRHGLSPPPPDPHRQSPHRRRALARGRGVRGARLVADWGLRPHRQRVDGRGRLRDHFARQRHEPAGSRWDSALPGADRPTQPGCRHDRRARRCRRSASSSGCSTCSRSSARSSPIRPGPAT